MNIRLKVNKELNIFGKYTLDLREISHYNGISRRSFPYHYHNYFELSLVVQGKTLFMVNGEPFTCNAGQAVLVAPDCLHAVSTDSLEESDSVWTFRFLTEADSPLARQTHLRACIISLREKTEFINTLLFQMAALERKSAYALEYIYPCTLLLFHLLLEEFERETTVYEDHSDQEYRRILQYIMENYKNSFSLDDLASHCFTSKSHLMRCFKQNFGISPIRYRNELLVSESCYYLTETDKNTQDISNLLGFDSPSVFIRSFRRYMQMTPSAYRAQFREKSMQLQNPPESAAIREHINFLYPLIE